MESGRYVYFLYSQEQREARVNIEANIGQKYKPKKVNVNGRWVEFTEMNTIGTSRYSDARIVAEGYSNLMKIID